MDDDSMSKSGRRRAYEWPYPRHENFVRTQRLAASSWLALHKTVQAAQ